MELNGDGKLDLLSGSYSRKEQNMAGLLFVLHGHEGGFKKATPLLGSDGIGVHEDLYGILYTVDRIPQTEKSKFYP